MSRGVYRRILPVPYARAMQRRALALLFAVLALVLAAVSAEAFTGAGSARRVVVGVATAAVAAWLATLSVGALRRRR